MADTSRARRWAEQAATRLPGRSFFAKQQTKIVAAVTIAMLIISNIPASALGRIGTLSAANIIASSFSGQQMPILDCGPGSPYGLPCNPGGEWSDLNGHPGGIPGGALLVSGLQPGDKVAINNISGTINEGNALASCRSGLDPQDTALPKLIGIVQFTNDAGQVVSVGGGVNSTNAMYLNSFEGAGLTVPAGATKMYGSFPDTVYSDNQGSCSFTITVTPANTGGGGGPCTISDKATFQQYVQNGQVSFQFFNDPSKAESSITVSNHSACTITGTSLQIDSIFQAGDQNDINSAMYKSQQPFYESPIQSVPPGQTVNFWAKNPGCDFQEDLAFNHAPGFGQVELNQPGGFCPSVNSAQCVSITAPDTVTPGQQFPVTVVMKNTSSYGDWFGEGLFHYPYRLGEVAANGTYDQGDWGAGRVNMTDGLVTPGNNETFNFTATAPTTPGTYNSFNFRMLEEGHEWFGGNIPIPIPNASICSKTITVQNPVSSSSSSSSVSSSSSSGVGGAANLSIAKSADQSSVVVGGTANYTISVTNNGPATAMHVVVTDTAPAGFTLTNSDAGCFQNGSTVTCILGSMQPGTRTIHMSFAVPNPGNCSATQTVTNSASVRADNLGSGNTTASAPMQVTCPTPQNADLSITKTASSQNVTVGQNVTYTIQVHNAGPADATNVNVIDTLPQGLTVQSFSPTQGGNSISGNQDTWSVGTLANGQTATLTMVATVTSAGQITNSASVQSNNPDTNSGNNQTSVTITGQPMSSSSSSSSSVSSAPTMTNMTITKTGPASVMAGQNATYLLKLHNSGPVDAQNVQVVDVMGARFNYVSSPDTNCSVQSGNNLLCNVGTVGNGQDRTVTLVLNVIGSSDVCSAGQTFNVGTVGGTNVQNSINSISTVYTPVSCVSSSSSSSSMSSSSSSSSVNTNADISVSKTASNQTVTVGQNVTYTVQVHNNGPADAQNVTVNDQLPSGLSLVTDLVTQGTYNGSTWNVGTLGNGQTATLQVIATVTSAGQITNTATGTSNNPDNNGGNNTGTVTITGQPTSSSSSSSSSVSSSSSSVNTNADLSVSKTASSQIVTVGQTVTYTVLVHNDGPAAAMNVSVSDQLPQGLTYVSSFATQGNYSNGVWNVGTLSDNQNAQLQIVAMVTSAGQITNIATGTSNNPDNNGGNNTGTVTITGTPASSSSSSSSLSSSSSSQPPLPGCIQILKEAYNANGQSLSPVPQFTFQLDNGQTVTSDANGNARFDNVPVGNHTVTEVVPAGWNQILVTPQNGQLFVPSGSFCAGIAFKNQQSLPASSSSSMSSVMSSQPSSSSSSAPPLTGCINVQKQAYNVAGNPITPVPQFVFTLDGNQTAVNDANGNAFFGNVTPGNHTITESLPSGWAQIQAPSTIAVQGGMSCANALFKNQQTVPVSSSSSSSSSMISSSSSSSSSVQPIVGCVSILKETFDQNGNSLTPVAPFLFRIDNGPVVMNDANGYARFDNVTPGMHTITEIPQTGWNQILVTPQGGQVNVPSGNLCAGIVFKNQKAGGSQNVIINSNSNTSVNSIINANSNNTITINQNGGGNQNAGVNGNANTSVDSTINATSGNVTNVTQNGLSSAAQNALVNTQALNTVGSMINATGANVITIDQNNAVGVGTQNAAAAGNGATGVTSAINAASGNATNVQQNSNPLNPNPAAPIHLIPLTNAAQPQGPTPQTVSVNTTLTANDQQGMMQALLSWIDQLRQQIITMFGHP